MKKLIIPISLVLLYACGNTEKPKEEQKEDDNISAVTIASVDQQPFAEKVTFQGTVEAEQNVLVSPQSNGVIRGIFVKEGEKVAAGKTLASLDSDIINQNAAEVEKSLELATYMYEKQIKLKEKGVGVELQLEQAKNQKESLERRLSTLGTQASKNIVYAPITGYVDEIIPNVGEMASPGIPMFRVINLNKVTVKADISENYLMDIQQGNAVEIYFPSIDYTIKDLTITRSSKFINPNNRTYDIQIDIDNKDQLILPNLLAEVIVTKDFTQDALIVPSISVLEDNKGQKYVYLYNNGIAKKQNIKVDFVDGDLTQVTKGSGLKKGDNVIVKGVTAIVDGEKVKLFETPKKG